MNSQDAEPFSALKYFCLFIGYPRSGHSLVGSIIDAHQEACVSHEFDVLLQYPSYKNKEALFAEIIELSAGQAKTGRASYGYQYAYDNLHQGKSESLRVIGDKKGGSTTQQLFKNEFALDAFAQFVQLPLKVIHVTRNPFDIITTKAGYKNLKPVELDARGINKSIEVITQEAQTNQKIIASGKYQIHSFAHEQLILDTEQTLKELFAFLELEIDSTFINTVANKLYKKTSNSRSKYSWSAREISMVESGILSLPVFSSYCYEK
jgi:hypothetical protein